MDRRVRQEAVAPDAAAMLERLQEAAGAEHRPNEALDSLTGEWDLSEVKRAAASGTRPRHRARPTQRRTLYLDEQAEADLSFLRSKLGTEARATRSDVVRRALHATRLAAESS